MLPGLVAKLHFAISNREPERGGAEHGRDGTPPAPARAHRYSPVWPSSRCEAMAWMSRSRRMR